MHTFVVEYSTSYGLQCVCNSNEEKKLQNYNQQHKSDITLCNNYCA